MHKIIKRSRTSVIFRVFLYDSTGAAKTGLTNASAGLIIAVGRDNQNGVTTYAQASSNIETITTLGTWAAPTASKVRFKEVDATNQPGVYEVQGSNSVFSDASASELLWMFSGAGLTSCPVVMEISDLDLQDAVRAGLTAFPNVAQGNTGQIPTADSSGRVTVITNSDKTGYALTSAEHTLVASDVQTGMTSQGFTTTRAGYLDTLNGLVQAIWDKATSALTTAGSIGKKIVDNLDSTISGVPAAVWAVGTRTLSAFGFSVTVATNNDKTGYALTSAEHTLVASDTQTGMTSQGYTTTRAPYLDTLNGLVQAVWDKATSTLTTAGSIGKRLVDNIDAAISAIKTQTDKLAFTGAKVDAQVRGFDANVIDAASIANAAIDAATFATGAIDANALADNAIDAGAIAAGAITNSKFAAGAIDASAIATDAIDNDAIAPSAVTEIQNGLATAAGVTAVGAGVTTLLGRLSDARATLLDNLARLDVAISSRSNHTPAQVRTEMDANSVDLDAIQAALVAVLSDLTLLDVASSTINNNVSAVGGAVTAVNSNVTSVGTLVNSVLARLGAFTGTGVNTVLGFFRSLARKDLAAPSDMGGTFDPATDSNEAVRDHGDTAWMTATGFPSSADYTPQRAALLDNLDAPVSGLSTLTAADVRTEMDANSTKLAHLDADMTSRLADADFVAPDNAGIAAIGGLAASIDGKTDKIDGMLEAASPGFRFTSEALDQAPTSASAFNANEVAEIKTVLGVTGTGTPIDIPTDGPLLALYNKLQSIPAGDISVVGPVAVGGDVHLIQGYDYTVASGQALIWNSDGWPDLTSASVYLVDQAKNVIKQGVVAVAGTGTQSVRVELTKQDLQTLGNNKRTIRIWADLPGSANDVALVSAMMTITH